jgi:tight adherence protein B
VNLSSVRRGVRAVVVSGAALAVLVAVAPPSAGQTAAGSGHTAQLVEVNSSNQSSVNVVFRYDGPASDVAGAKVTENGKPTQPSSAPTPALAAKRDVGVVIVQDASGSTDTDGTLAEGRAAVKALVPTLAKGTQVAVVGTGSDAIMAQNFTTDATLIDKAMNSFTPSGDGALWEGVTRAASAIASQPNMIGSIILITDGNDGKGTSFSAAKGSAVEAGVAVFGVGISNKVGGQPQELAAATGGTFTLTDKATEASTILGGFTPKLNGLYTFSFKGTQDKGVSDLQISVGDATVTGSYSVGSDARGASALAYQPPQGASGIAGLQNSFGKSLAIVLGLIAAGLAAYAIIGIAVKDQSGLASVLQPYSEGYVARTATDDDDDEAGDSGMAQTAVMQRAVEMTRQFAEDRGFLAWVEGALERANLPLRAAEAMFFYAAGVVVLALLSAVLTRSPFVALIVLAIAALTPLGVLSFLSNRRKRQFEAMLPDTLQLLSGTLRAGYSMMQGVEAVSQEVSEPMGRELRRVVTEARLGRPLEESLDSVAERMDSPDFGWAVMAIRIQREVGGNLSELLLTVAETMTQRERLKRDVKSLTAEGRISAYVLAALPVLLGIAMWGINPDYMSALFDETVGKIALGLGVVMMIGGFLWMQAIVKIDV